MPASKLTAAPKMMCSRAETKGEADTQNRKMLDEAGDFQLVDVANTPAMSKSQHSWRDSAGIGF